MLLQTMERFSFTSALIVLALFFQTVPLQGQTATRFKISGTLSATDLGSWRTIQKGVEQRKIAFLRSEPNYTLELRLLRFDPKIIGARILSSGDFQLKSATVKDFVEKSGAIAAINANYFDERGRPLAYLKTGNNEINRALSKHALYTGVFAVADGHPQVMHRDDFSPAQASEALQSGPLLLNRGAPVETMRNLGRYARRAVLGVDKAGRIVIAVTDAVLGGLSFVELQELFANGKWQLDTPELLNLDGGGSAQLYFKSGRLEESVPGTSEVPVAIGFFVKAN
ncbi:MAG: phosphodiester glycosidase family protein [Candidatus Binatia bacterium]